MQKPKGKSPYYEQKKKPPYRDFQEKKPQIDPEVDKIIKEIDKLQMLNQLKTKDFADENGFADKVAQKIRGTKTAQLYKFFASIRKMQKGLKQTHEWNGIEGAFYLLKPQIAYAKGRELIQNEFYRILMALFSKVDVGTNDEKIENFNKMVQFLEAIVAFHKFHYSGGGR